MVLFHRIRRLLNPVCNIMLTYYFDFFKWQIWMVLFFVLWSMYLNSIAHLLGQNYHEISTGISGLHTTGATSRFASRVGQNHVTCGETSRSRMGWRRRLSYSRGMGGAAPSGFEGRKPPGKFLGSMVVSRPKSYVAFHCHRYQVIWSILSIACTRD